MTDLDVRGRLPDRYRPALDTAGAIVETVVGVVLQCAMFVIVAALPFGVLTGDLAVSSAATVFGVMIGSTVLTYGVSRLIDGDLEPVTMVLVLAEIAVYSVLGVGIAVLPTVGEALLFYGGLTLAALVYLRQEWFMARLGFESTGSDPEVAA
jgi:hypothetical protein